MTLQSPSEIRSGSSSFKTSSRQNPQRSRLNRLGNSLFVEELVAIAVRFTPRGRLDLASRASAEVILSFDR